MTICGAEAKKHKCVRIKYEKFNSLLEQRTIAKTKRESDPTNPTMINDVSSWTRYRRKSETKNILEYIHAGVEGATYGAWDFLTHAITVERLEQLLLQHMKEKFIEKRQGKFMNNLENSDTATKQAVLFARCKNQSLCYLLLARSITLAGYMLEWFSTIYKCLLQWI